MRMMSDGAASDIGHPLAKLVPYQRGRFVQCGRGIWGISSGCWGSMSGTTSFVTRSYYSVPPGIGGIRVWNAGLKVLGSRALRVLEAKSSGTFFCSIALQPVSPRSEPSGRCDDCSTYWGAPSEEIIAVKPS